MFCYVLSHVSNYLSVISLPSLPRCSVSPGFNVAPAHTSTRHEAVRVWLESMSGGSTDLKWIMRSCLRLVFSLSISWPVLEHAQTHAETSRLTSMHALILSHLRAQHSSALLGSDQHLHFTFHKPTFHLALPSLGKSMDISSTSAVIYSRDKASAMAWKHLTKSQCNLPIMVSAVLAHLCRL